MTSTAPSTAAEANPMAHTPDMRTDRPAEAVAAEPAAAGTQSRLLAILGDNPLATATAALLTVMGSVALALLVFTLNSIDSHIGRLDDRIDRLEDTVAAGFATQDAKIDEVDRRLTAQIAELDLKLTAQIAELDLKLTTQNAELDRKLTALIAALNKTDEVDAALEGRLLDSEPAVARPDDAPADGAESTTW